MFTIKTLTTIPQYLLPHHLLSTLMSKLTHCENTVWKNLLITQIIKYYNVNMNESDTANINEFKSFNDFFTRKLKADARIFTDQKNDIACPADGAISQAGIIDEGQIFQAKGKRYTTIDLLGGDTNHAKLFINGSFATIYLSPKDYHRLHMPLTGTLKEMTHIPGRLFSVNKTTTETVDGLFTRNERVVALFDTEAGPMALILVGAIFVSSIETVWHGVVSPPTHSKVRNWKYNHNAPILKIGEEMGRFNMGSTIIVLFGKDKTQWINSLRADKTVQLGEKIGTILKTI